jgi:P27 family predicted phage terminase small subunit
MNKTGILYKSKSGYIQQSPLLGIIHTQTTIVNNLLREFGLTPSSRTQVAIVSIREKAESLRRAGQGCARLSGGRPTGQLTRG